MIPSLVRALLLLMLVGAVVAGLAAYSITRSGLSTRVAPGVVEERIALAMRRLATPAAVRARANPVPASSEVLEDALAHFADHCAGCHGNDGSGDTALGKGFYPPSPDMRAPRTQSLTDGELFSIIENGIRLTGMPAWGDGTPEGQDSTWGLVHFIRRLPTLTAEEVARMETLNPRSPAAFREEEEIRRFLDGDDAPAGVPPRPHSVPHKPGH